VGALSCLIRRLPNLRIEAADTATTRDRHKKFADVFAPQQACALEEAAPSSYWGCDPPRNLRGIEEHA
jgi:hypothetical protein